MRNWRKTLGIYKRGAIEYRHNDRIHPDLEGKIRDKGTPYSTNPAIPEGWEESVVTKRFNNVVGKVKDYSGAPTAKQAQSLRNGILGTVKELESTNKTYLESLAVQVVRQVFGINGDEVLFDAKLITSSSETDIDKIVRKKDIEQMMEMEGGGEDEREYGQEIQKRRIINGFIQGASIVDQYKFHMVDPELQTIDPNLPKMYDFLRSFTEYKYWMSSALGSGVSAGGVPTSINGTTRVDLSGDVPKIVARAVIFPILVNEFIKGMMELVSMHGLSKDPRVRQKALHHADTRDDEPWDLRFGPELWSKFVEMGGIQNDPRKQMSLYENLVKLDPDSFSQIIKEMLQDNPRAKEFIQSHI
jgi:hypothetical protein